MVVGTSIAVCLLSAADLKAALTATSVLPKPTSPQTSRSIGCAPKSTGPEHFKRSWLDAALAGRTLAPRDVLATLSELTARSIADAVHKHARAAKKLYVCGGGAHNLHLMTRLAADLPGVAVASTEALGIHPDWVEAAGFAWLARETLEARPGNLPSVTGAGKSTVLGAIYPV